MEELNPNGDSQEVVTPVVEEVETPVVETKPEEPIVEPLKEVEEVVVQPTADESVDKLFQDKKFVDSFFSRVGDGMKTIVDKQVESAVTDALKDARETPGKTEEKSAPAKVETHKELEQIKEPVNDEVTQLKSRLAELEGDKLEKSIRDIPQIKQLIEVNPQEANRFVTRAKSIADANGLNPSEVSRIFAEGSDIAKDVNNQLLSLSKGTDINKPVNKIINQPTTQPKTNRGSDMAKYFYGK